MQESIVKDWMTNVVVFVDPELSVYEGLQLMRHRFLTNLIVRKTPASPEYGIVTSINICDKIVAQDRNPKELKVKDIMASPLITVPADLPIKECAALMKENRIHHLPVANEKGEIVGMIAAMDLLMVAEGMGVNFEDRRLH